MRVCYVDEAGCPGTLPTSTSDIQPVLAVAGLSVPQQGVGSLTTDFLHLKKRFFPALHTGDFLDLVLPEVKGSDIRRDAARQGRRQWRPALQFLGEVFRLFDNHDAVSSVSQCFEGIDEDLIVPGMKTNSGLIQNITGSPQIGA